MYFAQRSWESYQGDDDVPGYVLKLVGEDDLKIMTQLINNIYTTGEWLKDLIEEIIALKKNQKLQNAATTTQSASSHIWQI